MGIVPFLAAVMALAVVAAGQASVACPPANQSCGAQCCGGPPSIWNCLNGACLDELMTSHIPITLLTTSPTPGPTTPIATATGSVSSVETTVAIPVVSSTIATHVSTANVTSWSTTAFSTANGTASTDTADHSHSETGKPKPTGAAVMLVPGGGLLGVAIAVALGAL